MPTKLYWIKNATCWRLAIMPRPRAGDWLSDELLSFKSAGADVIVSLLTNDKIEELDLKQEPTHCESIGLTFLSYPIPDRDVPASHESFLSFLNQLHGYLKNNRGVAIHCRMGIGRSSVLAACLLVQSGLKPEDAFRQIAHDRGIDVPDTTEQAKWVELFASSIQAG